MTENNKKSFKRALSVKERVMCLIASFLLAMVSVTLPLFSNLATSLQSQNLYIGTVFAKGQAPYLDLFSTEGFLFHSLSGLATYFGGNYWLIPIQALCFYLSGVYLYKISSYLTQKKAVSHLVTGLFYLFNLALGFGGFYAIQLATPFVLMGLWFLVTYFDGERKDELFISYGLVAALALFLAPRTLVFWLLAFLVLSLYNSRHKLWARGVYQILSNLFGFILVAYSLGYLILNMQLLMPYLKQAVAYQFSQFQTETTGSFWGMAVQALAVLGLGILPGVFHSVKNFWKSPYQAILFLTFSVYFVFNLLSQSLAFYRLLDLLPFGLVMLALWLGQDKEDHLDANLRRHRKSEKPLKHYLKSSFYLPLVLVTLGLVRPVATYVADLSLYQDRQAIVTYLANKVASNDKIYVWDSSAKIGTDLAAFSASQFALPVLNTVSSAHQELLIDELLQGQATYLIVNPALPLSQDLEKELADNYQQVKLSKLNTITLYKLID